MSTDLDYGWAQPDDLAEVEAFHRKHFGAGSVQAVPGRVRWLYFDNPLGLHVALCRDGGRLVASCGHLAQDVPVAGEPVRAGFGIDFMVAPSHRRRGIGRRFLEMRTERFGLSLSTGQSPGMRALYAACGAVELGNFFVGVHRRRPPLRGGPRALARGWALWAAGLARGGGGVTPVREAGYPDADWFSWRFGGPVYSDYACLAGEEGARAAVRSDDGIRHVAGLADGAAGRTNLLRALARLPGAAETRVFGAGRQLEGALRAAGYLVRPAAAVLVALTADPELARRLEPGAVELDAGAADADLLRRP